MNKKKATFRLVDVDQSFSDEPTKQDPAKVILCYCLWTIWCKCALCAICLVLKSSSISISVETFVDGIFLFLCLKISIWLFRKAFHYSFTCLPGCVGCVFAYQWCCSYSAETNDQIKHSLWLFYCVTSFNWKHFTCWLWTETAPQKIHMSVFVAAPLK